jgi:hypothetical protein
MKEIFVRITNFFIESTHTNHFPIFKPAPVFQSGYAPVNFSFDNSGGEPKRTIRAGRRRQSDTPPSPQERATAPQRERPDSTYKPSSGQTWTGGTGGGTPLTSLFGTGTSSSGGKRPSILLIGLVMLCVVCVGIYMLSQGNINLSSLEQAIPTTVSDYSQPTQDNSNQEYANMVTQSAPKPTYAQSGSTTGQKWLVMLYQDADDKVLEQDVYMDLNEAERVGSSDRVQIVAQIDRYNGAYQGDGNWTGGKRFYLTQDNDLNTVNSQLIADIGEPNMASGNTLVDFVTWAVSSYPADKYILILSDHGMGWPGGWTDPTSTEGGNSSIPLSSALGDVLYTNELDQALSKIRNQTGIDKFELIGLDACLMSHLEVLSALEPHARFAVTSQEIEPSLGWAYASFLQGLEDNPDMNGAGLGQLIVNSYIQDDQRIVDQQARADFLSQTSPMGGSFGMYNQVSAAQITQQLEQNITIAAIDLAYIPDLMNSVNNLAYELQNEQQQVVALARTYARSFTSIFGTSVPKSYIDLGNFIQILQSEGKSQELTQVGNQVLESINQAVVAEKHGPNERGATGISIYFPNSQLYRSPMAGAPSYTAISDRFSRSSLWDDFLAFHYTGKTFEPATNAIAAPQSYQITRSPGTGQISISDISLSDQTAAPGKPVLMSTDISGENIGYIKLFVGYYDSTVNSIFIADLDYLDSSETRNVNGTYYPDWGDGTPFTLEFEWEPTLFTISDGTENPVVLLSPYSYGETTKQAVYTVDGKYTFSDGSETIQARLYFRDGILRQVFGFTGESDASAPHEITPQTGDTFLIMDKWMDLDQSGNTVKVSEQVGSLLTFGNSMFTWKELYAPAGEYLLGFFVEDMDGNAYQKYTQVTVE